MSDIGLFIVDNCIDLKIVDGDLAQDGGLETAVLVSLFTDKRSSAEELPAGETNRKGWWGDMFPDVENDKIGSKLWLSSRGKRSLAVLSDIEVQAKNALNWLIEDGVASEIVIEADFDDSEGIILDVSIAKPDDSKNLFKIFWNQQELKRA